MFVSRSHGHVPNADSANTHTHTATANYPTSAAEILPILKEKITILSGGRDRQGQSLVTFPAQTKTYMYDREDILRTVQYLTSIPT